MMRGKINELHSRPSGTSLERPRVQLLNFRLLITGRLDAHCKSTATQTEAHETRKKAPPKSQEPTVQQKLKAIKPANSTPGKSVEGDEKCRARYSMPVSYAAVAKEATKG